MDEPINRTKRRITTCVECHRRKQKCNREKPCNFCLRRGVPNRCRYDENPQSTATSYASDFLPSPSAVLQMPPTPKSPLLSLAGYSPRSSMNSIVQQADPAEAIPASPLTGANDVALIAGGASDQYTQLVAQLPPSDLVEELVAVFFSEANWHVQILDRVFFNVAHQAWLTMRTSILGQLRQAPLEQLVFPALLFQVLAVAVLFMPRGTMSEQTLGLWDHSAKSTLSEKWSNIGTKIATFFDQSSPVLVMVEHDLAKALWLKTSSRVLAAWKVLGRAIRQAQELGLHLSSESVHVPGESSQDILFRSWDEEYRRRLWITLFAWDSHMAVLLGRPRTINNSDCSQEAPIGCDIPSDRSTAFPSPTPPSSKPALFVNRLFTYALAQKIHEILSSSANSRSVGDYSVVTRLHGDIMELCRNHHPALRPNNPDTTWDQQHPVIRRQREFTKIMANSTLLTLHRDHVLVHPESRVEALNASLACLDAQHMLMGILPANQQRIYGLSCHAIDSCIFIAYVMNLQGVVETDMVDRVVMAIQRSIDRLEQLEDESPLAKAGAETLRNALASIHQRGQEFIGTHYGLDVENCETGGLSLTEPSFPMGLGLEFQDGRFHPEYFEEPADVRTFPGFIASCIADSRGNGLLD